MDTPWHEMGRLKQAATRSEFNQASLSVEKKRNKKSIPTSIGIDKNAKANAFMNKAAKHNVPINTSGIMILDSGEANSNAYDVVPTTAIRETMSNTPLNRPRPPPDDPPAWVLLE